MDTLLLLIVAGLCVVSSHAGREYHIYYIKKNMTAAQKYCREQYTDLATFDNMEDVMTVLNMTNHTRLSEASAGARAWIGLYDDRYNWKWSLADTSFYKDGETTYRSWGSGQPDNKKGAERCSEMTSLGGWHDRRCEESGVFVCLDVSGKNVTFVFINISMTWAQAQSYCRANYIDLASVRNKAEQRIVQDLIPANTTAWIGLFRDGWKWSDGSNLSFTHWREGEPKGSATCVAADLSLNGVWMAWRCDTWRAFICYSKTKTTTQATTTQTTTNQATTTQTTTNQATTTQTTTNQATTTQTTTNQATTTQTTTNQATTTQTTTNQATTNQATTKQTTTNQAATTQTTTNQATTNQATTKQATTKQATKKQDTKKQDMKNQAMSNQVMTKQDTKKQATTKQVFRVKFKKTDPSFDMNDPAAAENILKQIKQKLREKGLDDNVKLSWKKQPDGKVFHKEEKTTKKTKKKTRKVEL